MATLQGEIADIAFKYTGEGNEFVEVSVAQQGRQYSTKARAFDEALVARFHNAKKGQQVNLDIEEKPGTFQGKQVTYRNIVGILPLGQAPDQDEPAAQASSPAMQPSRPVERSSPSAAHGALDPLAMPPLDPHADKFSAFAYAYQEWNTSRRLALMSARELVRDFFASRPDLQPEWYDYNQHVLDAAEQLFAFARGIYNTYPSQGGEPV